MTACGHSKSRSNIHSTSWQQSLSLHLAAAVNSSCQLLGATHLGHADLPALGIFALWRARIFTVLRRQHHMPCCQNCRALLLCPHASASKGPGWSAVELSGQHDGATRLWTTAGTQLSADASHEMSRHGQEMICSGTRFLTYQVRHVP